MDVHLPVCLLACLSQDSQFRSDNNDIQKWRRIVFICAWAEVLLFFIEYLLAQSRVSTVTVSGGAVGHMIDSKTGSGEDWVLVAKLMPLACFIIIIIFALPAQAGLWAA
jgi:hypothetical protein